MGSGYKSKLDFQQNQFRKRDSLHEVTLEYSECIHFEWNLSQRTHAEQALASNQNALDNDLHKKSYKYLFICFTYVRALKMPTREKRKKYTHIFGIHLLLPRKKNAQKYYFFCMTFCCVFAFLSILVLTFVFRNFFSTISCLFGFAS